MKKPLKTIVLSSAIALSVALAPTFTAAQSSSHTMQSGDPLFKIAQKYDQTVNEPNTYTVKSGDSLFLISQTYGTSVQALKEMNDLSSDTIEIGQILFIPTTSKKNSNVVESKPTNTIKSYQKVKENPKLQTYVVQPGDTATSISEKFGSRYSPEKILNFNYMTENDWFDAGETIWVDGYAPRNYDVTPGESSKPSRYGTSIDWYKDGQYILKRNTNLRITDTLTGTQLTVTVMGGYNHADVEPITSYDTNIMKYLFKSWKWKPRPVTIYVDGMNIAGSLAGMPHSFDTISDNGVTGHFDLYVTNSQPHNPGTDRNYVRQHHQNILNISAAK